MTEAAVRVLVVDGDARVRQALRALTEEERDIIVVGDASTLSELPAWDQTLEPDVILLELVLAQKEHGLAIVRELSQPGRHTVVVTSMCGCLRDPALAAGARAYVEKGAAPEALVDAIRFAASQSVPEAWHKNPDTV
ncbi:MAG: response regulator [Chloroflexota bacterium]